MKAIFLAALALEADTVRTLFCPCTSGQRLVQVAESLCYGLLGLTKLAMWHILPHESAGDGLEWDSSLPPQF